MLLKSRAAHQTQLLLINVRVKTANKTYFSQDKFVISIKLRSEPNVAR
jgi:hypothetical protein